MNTKILELALKGMDRKTLVTNANALIMSIGEHSVTDALLLGIPKVTDIDINRYCFKNDYTAGLIGDITIVNTKVNPIEHQVTVTVEYNCIRYTNAEALDRFIKRDKYNRKNSTSYKSFCYYDDIYSTPTGKNTIPFFTKSVDTFYISLDSEYVKYTR